MEKEEVKTGESPAPTPPALDSVRDQVLFIYSEAAQYVGNYIQQAVEESNKNNEAAKLDLENVFKAIVSGITAASEKLNKGLVPLSVQEMQVLNTYNQIKSQLKPGETIRFAKGTAPNSAGLVGPDGKPLNTATKLIVPK